MCPCPCARRSLHLFPCPVFFCKADTRARAHVVFSVAYFRSAACVSSSDVASCYQQIWMLLCLHLMPQSAACSLSTWHHNHLHSLVCVGEPAQVLKYAGAPKRASAAGVSGALTEGPKGKPLDHAQQAASCSIEGTCCGPVSKEEISQQAGGLPVV